MKSVTETLYIDASACKITVCPNLEKVEWIYSSMRNRIFGGVRGR